MSSPINGNKHNPWLNSDNNHELPTDKKFDDDFVKVNYQPLADSTQYIARLENKLSKLKLNNKAKEDLVKAIENTWDSYMSRVIDSDTREQLDLNQDIELEESLTPNSINSWINPGQALTIGELAALIQNDSLSLNFEKQNENNF